MARISGRYSSAVSLRDSRSETHGRHLQIPFDFEGLHFLPCQKKVQDGSRHPDVVSRRPNLSHRARGFHSGPQGFHPRDFTGLELELCLLGEVLRQLQVVLGVP